MSFVPDRLKALLPRRRRERLVGIVLASLGVASVMAINEYAFRAAEYSLGVIRNHHQLRQDAVQLRALVVDAETSVRGYLLTGREAYLQPKTAATGEIQTLLARLKSGYTETSLDALVQDVDRQVQVMLALIDEKTTLYQQGRHDAWQALLMADLAKERMDAVREATERLVDHEASMIQVVRPRVFTALNLGRYGVHALALLSLLWWLYYLRKSEEAQDIMNSQADLLRVERDRFEQQLVARTQELTELARYLTQVREEERNHLARELHDELGALLTAAKLDVARLRRMAQAPTAPGVLAERLGHMGGLIDEGISLKRRIIENLRPSSLSNLGLVSAIEILAREFAERSDLKIDTTLSDVACDENGKLAIYRLIQESLTNVLRHAKARRVWIAMQAQAQGCLVSIRDDGVGFEPQAQSFGHHGLLGMRYRMESLGGELQVRSSPGQGTEVLATLPFPLLAAADAPPAPGLAAASPA